MWKKSGFYIEKIKKREGGYHRELKFICYNNGKKIISKSY